MRVRTLTKRMCNQEGALFDRLGGADETAKRFSSMLRDKQRVLVALEQNSIVASVSFTLGKPDKNGGILCIQSILLTDADAAGAAQTLLRRLCAKAGALGVTTLLAPRDESAPLLFAFGFVPDAADDDALLVYSLRGLTPFLPLCMGAGLLLGLLAGVLFGKILAGACIGACLGMLVGGAMDARRERREAQMTADAPAPVPPQSDFTPKPPNNRYDDAASSQDAEPQTPQTQRNFYDE